jgi:DNA primase catalytic subunit
MEKSYSLKDKEIGLREQRIRKIALAYYSRPDIRKAIYEFSKDRECVPRYFEGFGKRPDNFQFESDIISLAKKGATSFHCSEELWFDALQISTSTNKEEFNKLRKGWDLIIDVDSKYLDYSKIYAEILIDVLKSNKVKNIGVKFSGNKGFHIIVPWNSFPEEISGKKTSDMFPEWPRQICAYLSSKISLKLKNRVQDISGDKKDLLETYCIKCGSPTEKKHILNFLCSSCKSEMSLPYDVLSKKRKISCINCSRDLTSQIKEGSLGEKVYFDFCNKCNIDSLKNKENFQERVKSEHIDADLVLVSPRHLFRMPYSLHEKTALSSIVIDPDKIKEFDINQADPLKLKPINFLPKSEKGEASYLLREALEFKLPEIKLQPEQKQKTEFKPINIANISDEHFPPAIKKMLEGIKTDGRKRALFILLNFFKSLNINYSEISEKIEKWNAKNQEPLPEGYIKAQLSWHSKNPARMPPNYDKSYYKDIGIIPTAEEIASKNPVSYTLKKYYSRGNSRKNNK